MGTTSPSQHLCGALCPQEPSPHPLLGSGEVQPPARCPQPSGTQGRALQGVPTPPPPCQECWHCPVATLTRVLRHVVLELIHPLALVAAVRAEVFALLLVDPHVVLGRGTRGTVRGRPCRLPWGYAGLVLSQPVEATGFSSYVWHLGLSPGLERARQSRVHHGSLAQEALEGSGTAWPLKKSILLLAKTAHFPSITPRPAPLF